jgi:uncharacterized membrane-anchored protein YitT (DUF2179 family)
VSDTHAGDLVPADSAPPAQFAHSAHSNFEDGVALLCANTLIALGVSIYARDHLLTGGMAGLAFLAHYATGWRFGTLFFCLNLPFYVLAWRKMPRSFVLKTMAAVALMSGLSELTPQWISFESVEPLYAAILGGLLMGVGFLMLFRHRASLGGVGILVFYLQDRYGWRAGKIQMVIDCGIVLMALWTRPLPQVALSVVGAVVLNLVLAMNHRTDRYIAA